MTQLIEVAEDTPECQPRLGVEYSIQSDQVVQTIELDGSTFASTRAIPVGSTSGHASANDLWWKSYLEGNRPVIESKRGRLGVVDLFCASGGLSMGFKEAASAFGLEAQSLLGVDQDKRALEIYAANHDPVFTSTRSVDEIIDFHLSDGLGDIDFIGEPEILSDELNALRGQVDVVLAGPPCQGNSSLNNSMRHEDPRNRLYVHPAVIAVAVGAKAVLIENVPGVKRDKGSIYQRTEFLLKNQGFATVGLTIKAEQLGWPQTRHRFFLIGVKDGDIDLISEAVNALTNDPRSLGWAIEDLLDDDRDGIMDTTPELSADNQRRVEWLFKNDKDGEERFNLDDSERPDCHRIKEHSYKSSYGKMRWDRPAGTITTGFLTPGRGRFVHPKRPRVLTPREAARVQGFPDGYFDGDNHGSPVQRTELAKWIGDAVPAPLGFAASIGLIAQILV